MPINQLALTLSVLVSLSLMRVKQRVPAKTITVPTQWYKVKEFWKYQMENSSEQNFLSVRTRVTVSDAHSVVRMKTALMQMYWVKVFSARYTSMLGA